MPKYYNRCGDCGQAIKEHSHSGRASICDGCWDNREWLLKNRVAIGMTEFQKIQRSMASHRGTTRKRIEQLKKAQMPIPVEEKKDN